MVSDKGTPEKSKHDILQQTDYQYDSQGKLTGIRSNGQPVLTQKNDGQNRIAMRTNHNGIRGDYSYDSQGRLAKIAFSGGPLKKPISLEYTWDAGNELVSRSWNGETQWFSYDVAGRLTGVFSDRAKTKALETYQYDPAGNITEKMVYDEKAAMNYNAANQLVQMSGNGRSVSYTYDAAGRLTETVDSAVGKTSNHYGWLDKTVTLERKGIGAIALDYYPDGHLAVKGVVDSVLLAESMKPSATPVRGKDEEGTFAKLMKLVGLRTEDEAMNANACQTQMKVADVYVWDGLGLLRRNQEVYAIEPHISGGAAVYVARVGDLKSGRYLINDMLGTTLAEVDGEQIRFNNLSSFGLPVKKTPELPKPEATVPKVSVN
jgi:YD repeat-containing protein